MGNGRIIVTGASSGIGRACARLLASRGYATVLAGRDAARLEETLSQTPGAESFTGDLSSPDVCEALVEKSCRGGEVTGFVHAAGICRICPAGMVDERFMNESMRINCYAFQWVMGGLLRRKAVNEGFSAVALSSVSSSSGWPGGGAYAASKGALSALVRSMAVELAPLGARVNAVSPSNVVTPLLGRITAMKPPERIKELEKRQPLGFGKPEDVAAAVAFLVSPESRFITGADVPVDGGYLAS